MKYCFLILVLMPSKYLLAGAWGVGSFENDSALDWVYELENSNSIAFISQTFDEVQGSGYLSVDACSAALAAAEIVASINSGSLSHLPPEAQVWASNHSGVITLELKDSASRATINCANSDISEVAQLWAESASDVWLSYISELQSRLE